MGESDVSFSPFRSNSKKTEATENHFQGLNVRKIVESEEYPREKKEIDSEYVKEQESMDFHLPVFGSSALEDGKKASTQKERISSKIKEKLGSPRPGEINTSQFRVSSSDKKKLGPESKNLDANIFNSYNLSEVFELPANHSTEKLFYPLP